MGSGDREKSRNEMVLEIRQLRERILRLEESVLEKQNLQEKSLQLASIVESSDDAIIGKTVNGTIVNWNRAAERLYGYSAREACGQNVSILTPQDRKDEISNVITKLRKGDSVDHFETVRLRKDGTPIDVALSIFPILNSRAAVTGVCSITRDITERKRIENALRQSEEKYRSIFENAVEGIFQTTPEGRFISVNPAFAKIHGYESPEEMISRITSIKDQLYANPVDRERFANRLETDGVITAFETQFYRKDLSKIWVSMNARVPAPVDGGLICYEGTLEDVTMRKAAEEALRMEKKISDSTLDSLPGIFYMFDEHLKYQRWNKNLERISGYSANEISRMRVTGFIPVEDRRFIKEKVREVFEKGEATIEAELLTKDGRKIPFFFTGIRVVFSPERSSVIGVGIDITERKKSEKSLRESVARLRKAMVGVIGALVAAVEIRDPYMAGHQRRVAKLAEAIARKMKVSSDVIECTRMAASIHDLGKISVPAEVLSRPSRLSDPEGDLVERHARSGYEMLKDIEFPWPLAEVILQHHERLDGSGYPDHLKGDQIRMEARIIGIADVVEAIASPRPHRPARSIEAALAEIEKNKSTLYDPDLVDVCLALFRTEGFSFEQSE